MLALSNLYSFTCLTYFSSFSILHIIFMAETVMLRPPLGLMLCDLDSSQCVLQSLTQGRPELINSAFHLCCDICV